MKYTTSVITGKGRGKDLGYPTLNLILPEELSEQDGIYAAWVWIDGRKYKGAVHLGPIPVFGDEKRSFEVNVLDEKITTTPEIVQIELVKRIRDVKTFASASELSFQIGKDVEEIRSILS